MMCLYQLRQDVWWGTGLDTWR